MKLKIKIKKNVPIILPDIHVLMITVAPWRWSNDVNRWLNWFFIDNSSYQHVATQFYTYTRWVYIIYTSISFMMRKKKNSKNNKHPTIYAVRQNHTLKYGRTTAAVSERWRFSGCLSACVDGAKSAPLCSFRPLPLSLLSPGISQCTHINKCFERKHSIRLVPFKYCYTLVLL